MMLPTTNRRLSVTGGESGISTDTGAGGELRRLLTTSRNEAGSRFPQASHHPSRISLSDTAASQA